MIELATSWLDSKIRVYDINDENGTLSEPKIFEVDTLRLWDIDFSQNSKHILFGTMSLNVLGKLLNAI